MKLLLFPLLFLSLISAGQPLYHTNPYDCNVFSNPLKYQVKHRQNINFHASIAPQNNRFPSGADTGCLINNGINNWILIKIDSLFSGDTLILNFSNTKNVDFDAAIYGPILGNNLINTCSATINSPYSCEAEANPLSTLILPDVQIGQVFALVINNPSNINAEIFLNQPIGGFVDFYIPQELKCDKPDGVLTGTNTIQLGESALLTGLFTSINDWNFNISNLGRLVTSSGPPTIYWVKPSTTTLYELQNVSNYCGFGKSEGLAIVSVCDSDSAISLIARKNMIWRGDSTELILSSKRTLPYNFSITNYGSGIATQNPFFIKTLNLETQSFELFNSGIICENSKAVTVVVEEKVETKKLVSCFGFDGNLNDNLSSSTIIANNISYDFNRNADFQSALKLGTSSNTEINLAEFFVDQYSISLWIKPDIITLTNDSSYIFCMGQKNGEQSFIIEKFGGSYFLIFKSYYSLNYFNLLKIEMPSYIDLSNWNMLTVTKSKRTLTIYLNDKKVGEKILSNSDTFYSSNIFKIGSNFQNNKKFSGSIDQLKIFNGSLVEEEIKSIYFSSNCEFNYLERRKPELISCYPFNGNSNDQVNSNHGKISGAVITTDRFGNQNSAYYLNGNSYISLPNWSLNLQSYSVSGWVKMGNTNSVNTIFNFGGVDSNGGVLYFSEKSFYPNIIKFNYALESGDKTTAKTENVITSPEYYVNNWFHFVIIREPNYAKLFINGQLIGKLSTSNNTHSFFENGSGFRAVIGANANQAFKGHPLAFTQFFKGSIDDFKIFSGAILDSDVIKLFNENNNSCKYKYCPDFVLLPKSYYYQDNSINGKIELESSEHLPNNATKNYFSEKSIILKPGFLTSSNNVFKAEILNCN